MQFAEQQLVSCAGIHEGYQNMGCQGGRSDWAYDYLATHKIMKTSDYPYVSGNTGQRGTCNYVESLGVTEVSSYTYVTP